MGKLEKLLPLDVAAERLGLSVETLTSMITSGRIKANEHKGEILVPESEIDSAVTREQFSKLRGTPITISDAEQRYGVPNPTLWRWIKRGLISKVNTPSYPTLVDESDVAYCVAVYRFRGKSSRMFDAAGRPYQLKRPELAEYRRRRAKERQSA